MVKNAKEDQALENLFEQYDSEINNIIEKEEKDNCSGTSSSNKTHCWKPQKTKKEIS